MIRFLKNILVLIAILAVINFIFYAIVKSGNKKDYEEVDTAFETYLLADSRGVPLGDLSAYKVSNFSYDSDSYLDMEIKLNYLIKRYPVKKIFLTVDEHTLSKYREKTNNSDKSVFYAEIPDSVNSYKLLKKRILRKYIPFFNAKNGQIIKYYFQTFFDKKEEIKDWSSVSKKEQLEKSKSRLKTQFPHIEKSFSLTHSLERIILTCKENNIELVGIKFPLTKVYHHCLEDRNYGADSIFQSQELPIKDFKIWNLENDKLFKNQDHLNEKGASLFAHDLFN